MVAETAGDVRYALRQPNVRDVRCLESSEVEGHVVSAPRAKLACRFPFTPHLQARPGPGVRPLGHGHMGEGRTCERLLQLYPPHIYQMCLNLPIRTVHVGAAEGEPSIVPFGVSARRLFRYVPVYMGLRDIATCCTSCVRGEPSSRPAVVLGA